MDSTIARSTHLANTADPDGVARLLSVLADATRLRILALRGAGDRCVCAIHQSLDLPQPTVSRHLAHLRRAGLVAGQKDGLWAHYRLSSPTEQASRALVDAVEACVAASPAAREDRARLDALPACCAHARTVDRHSPVVAGRQPPSPPREDEQPSEVARGSHPADWFVASV
jgi:ArsR family transcriptional regulator